MSAWHLVRAAAPEWDGGLPRGAESGDLLHLALDAPSSANTLTRAVLEELEAITPRIAAERDAAGLVLWSAKEDHFIAGADIDEIAAVANAEDGRLLAALGQRIFTGLSRLPFPTFCVIHGTCLGGGLELALALDYRLAVDRAQTRIGLPEVNLGIIPGFGGTQRLPRLIGVRAALALILGASRLPARAAHAKGVVDVLLPAEGFRSQALTAIRKIIADGGRAVRARRKSRRGLADRLLDGNPLGRAFVRRQARKQV
ncbi:MAG: enoyl-CoA hydratase-related protein, partial [Planctomycetes bacterium]|nr:enoyl-CoA hydratase-related protein [Planctomycetota bacterium]